MHRGTWCFPGLCWDFAAYGQIHIDKDGGLSRLFTASIIISLQAERSSLAAAVLVSFIRDSRQWVIITLIVGIKLIYCFALVSFET